MLDKETAFGDTKRYHGGGSFCVNMTARKAKKDDRAYDQSQYRRPAYAG